MLVVLVEFLIMSLGWVPVLEIVAVLLTLLRVQEATNSAVSHSMIVMVALALGLIWEVIAQFLMKLPAHPIQVLVVP